MSERDEAAGAGLDEAAVALMASGGDGRIDLDPATGLNRYYSAPRPSKVLAYASSTANDISAAAFAHVRGVLASIASVTPAKAGVQSEAGLDTGLRRYDEIELSPDRYTQALEGLRGRIRA